MAPVTQASDQADFTAKEVGSKAQPHGEFSQQLAAIPQALDAPANGLPDFAANHPREDGAVPEQREATPPSHPMQMPATSDTAAASVIAEPTKIDRAKVNAGPGPVGDSAQRLPVPPTPASVQGVQPASNEARLRQAFEQFLNERQKAPIGPRDREALFVEFKNSLSNRLARAAAPTPAGKEGVRRVESWQAVNTTNLHELASAASTVVATIPKGSTFSVIERSKEGKWLKIETPDGSTGYYWAARAREMR